MNTLLLLIIIGFGVYFYYNPKVLQDIILKIQNQAAADQPIIGPTIPPTTTIPPVHCVGEWSTWAPKCNSYNDNYHKCSDNYNAGDKNISTRVYKITQQKNSNGQACPYADNYVETDYCNTATSKPIIPVNKCSYNISTRKPYNSCSFNDLLDTNNCISLKKNGITLPPTSSSLYSDVLSKVIETSKPVPESFKQLIECNNCFKNYGGMTIKVDGRQMSSIPRECGTVCSNIILSGTPNSYLNSFIVTYKPFVETCNNNTCYETCPPNHTFNNSSNKCIY